MSADSSVNATNVRGVGMPARASARLPNSLSLEMLADWKLLTTRCPSDSRVAVAWMFL